MINEITKKLSADKSVNNLSKPLFIGICGGTAAGKTTIAYQIADKLPGKVAIVEQDAYNKDLSHLNLSLEEAIVEINFDHPSILDIELLTNHLDKLSKRHNIERPIFDVNTLSRTSEVDVIQSQEVIILEGILIFTIPEIRKYLDYSIFIDVPDDIRLLRRMERDFSRYNRSFNRTKKQYLNTIKPMHDQLIHPSKQYADLVISDGNQELLVTLVVSWVKQQLGKIS